MHPLVSILIGGALTLAGTWVAHALQFRREVARHKLEEAARRRRELKEAYAEWFAAQQKMANYLTAFRMLKAEDRPSPESMLDRVGGDMIALGTRVRLLEPRADARERLATLLGRLSELAALTTLSKTEMDALQHVGKFSTYLGEFEKWLLEVRFAGEEA